MKHKKPRIKRMYADGGTGSEKIMIEIIKKKKKRNLSEHASSAGLHTAVL